MIDLSDDWSRASRSRVRSQVKSMKSAGKDGKSASLSEEKRQSGVDGRAKKFDLRDWKRARDAVKAGRDQIESSGIESNRIGSNRSESNCWQEKSAARSFSPRDGIIECSSRTIGTSMERDKRIGFEYRASDAAPIGITGKRQRAVGKNPTLPRFVPQGLES